jgi:hypothetical protein
MRLTFIALLAALVAGCSPRSAVEGLLTAEERRLVEGAIDDVGRGDGDALAQRMQPALSQEVPSALPAMRKYLPAPPRKLEIAAVNVRILGDRRAVRTVYQVEGRSGWAIVEAIVSNEGAKPKLAGLHIQQSTTAPIEVNRVRLADAGLRQWSMLVALFAAVAVTIAGLIRIWRSGLFRRRWLWTLGAVLGMTTTRMNWTTGDVSFHPISFQIFSMSAFKMPIFAPWIIGVSNPVVALVALFRRQREEGPATEASADA